MFGFERNERKEKKLNAKVKNKGAKKKEVGFFLFFVMERN